MHTELGKDIQRALELLQKGKQVAVPTETVYGLAADANHEEAVLGIFAAKNRPHANPLILHFDCLHSAEPYMLSFPAVFKQLYASFCPGPLTFIVPKSSLVSELITGGQDTVAIRFPKHEVLQNLLQAFGRPLAAPSANLYGQLSPTTAQHVFSQLNGRIPYILDGSACDQGLESTIIGLENERVLIYRYGGVRTSGMVKYHYATQTPLYLGFKNEQGQNADLQILLADDESISEPKMILSQSGSLTEAAQNLYAMLHTADAIGVERIFVEPFPPEGLGAAMNDRLSRAAAKFTSKG
jgi:L-threonylcarbamoyladenylate synthase